MNAFAVFSVTGAEEDSLVMISGKEFSLIRTVGGKVRDKAFVFDDLWLSIYFFKSQTKKQNIQLKNNILKCFLNCV